MWGPSGSRFGIPSFDCATGNGNCAVYFKSKRILIQAWFFNMYFKYKNILFYFKKKFGK